MDSIRGDDRTIVGISGAWGHPRGRQVVLIPVREYMESSDQDFYDWNRIIFANDYMLDGYGTHNEQILGVTFRMFTHYGIALDTTYTGKVFWGNAGVSQKTEVTGKNILVIDTGDTLLSIMT